MTIKQRITAAVSSLLPNNAVFAEYYKRSRPEWTRQPDLLQAKEIKDWKNGVAAATDPENPRRGDLMRFYRNLMLDNHLASVIDTRILRVQRSSFKLLDDNDNENYKLKALLERPWFEELVRLVITSRFQGTTLIELFDTDAETSELETVTEIPQSNFIAPKGVIIKDEYDDDGADYRNGVYKDYYLQIGGDRDLGMLNQLAMIVLAKKLGIGSWMSYVDKYGVPPVFVITDRKDAGRLKDLSNMMSDFRQSSYLVLQGGEKIEVPNISQSNSHQVFLALIDEVCNKEISKRVLGGTATTDQKSFVGAAEVQERVAQDRYEADKLLFKYVFNTKIRQRLVKISPLYKDFAKYTLEWDNQETLDINKYIDAVRNLSVGYEFDIDEIRARTGLPITGIKQPANPLLPAMPEPVKKKVDAVRTVGARHVGARYAAPLRYDAPDAAAWDAATEQLAEQIWNGKINAADLCRDLVLKYYAGLNKAAQSGWGGGYYTEKTTRNFRENLLRFSGAKSYGLIEKIIEAKAGETAKDVFLNKAVALVNTHNETWQSVEEKFAANAASSARDFQTFQKDADIYPNLKFRTMGDTNVRPDHAANGGIVKPVNQWTRIPPLDYGCRCWLEQTTEKPDGKDISSFNDTVAGNAAISGKLFEEKHPYFQRVKKEDRQAVAANTDLMKEFMPYNTQIKVGDKSVYINDFADLNDLKPNIEAAKIVAEFLKKDVFIRPHITVAQGHPNPEFGIGTKNTFADLKTMEKDSKNFFDSRMRSASKQSCKLVVMNIDNYNGNVSELRSKIKNGFEYNGKSKNGNIEKIIIIRNKKAIQLTRKQVNKDLFGDLEKLQ